MPGVTGTSLESRDGLQFLRELAIITSEEILEEFMHRKGRVLLSPMRLAPQVKEVVWGGRWLADALGRESAPDARLGESWEAYSGSIVSTGVHEGRTLGDLFSEFGAAMFGETTDGCPRFPLLAKFIDARQNLSIQVHPDDDFARELEGYPYGKTEFWYVLEAAPGAEIVCGLAGEGLTRAELHAALSGPDSSRLWNRVPVRVGDVVFIPAGTVHALTEGVVVYELQQDCDITYRLFDWGRTDREIHTEKGIQVTKTDCPTCLLSQPVMNRHAGYGVGELVTCDYFRARLCVIDDSLVLPARSDSFALITIIEGEGEVRGSGGDNALMRLRKGDTVLVPSGTGVTVAAVSGRECVLIAAALK